MKDAYEQNREDKYLQTSRNALETLERMDNERYDIILQISEDITERWSPEMQDALEKLGAKVDLTKEGNKNYVAHLSKGKSVFEQSSENEISYEGKMSDGTKVKVPYAVSSSELKKWGAILADFIKYLKERPQSRKIQYLAQEKHDVKCCYRCGFVYKEGNICPECGCKSNQ